MCLQVLSCQLNTNEGVHKNMEDFKNVKIYDYDDGSKETVFYAPGWKTTRKPTQKSCARGESFDYEKSRSKTISKAKARVRRIVKHYKLRVLITLIVGDESLTIKEADLKVQYFRKKLNNNIPSFKTWLTTRFYNINHQVCYKILTNVFISPFVLQDSWKYGSVSAEQLKGSEEKIVLNFTADFNDVRFRSHKLYSPARGMDLPYREFYFIDEAELESFMRESCPELRKKYEKKYDGGALKIIDYG